MSTLTLEPTLTFTPIKAATPPRPKLWTYEDYLRLPNDGKRYEIIEGVLYMANAPSYEHQFTVSELHLEIGLLVRQQRLGVVLVAPFEIHLPNVAKPVQPDVFFISAAHQPHGPLQIFEGAPDLIVEVISPSSVRLDRAIKFSAYERSGVKEYWLVDLRTRFIEIYTLAENGEYELLGQFGPGEQTRSQILPELAITVDNLFSTTA